MEAIFLTTGALKTVAIGDLDRHAAARWLFLPPKPTSTRLARARKRHYTFARHFKAAANGPEVAGHVASSRP